MFSFLLSIKLIAARTPSFFFSLHRQRIKITSRHFPLKESREEKTTAPRRGFTNVSMYKHRLESRVIGLHGFDVERSSVLLRQMNALVVGLLPNRRAMQ